MKPEDLKESIDSVKADDYFKTRLFAKVSEAEKPKRKFGKAFKIAVSAALCLTVLAAGAGFGIPQFLIENRSNDDIVVDEGNMFILSVYAEVGNGTPVTDHTVILPDYKIERSFDKNGEVDEIHGHSESGFCVEGKNIDSVKYTCKTGTFGICDFDLKNHLIETGEYFDAVVPYSDEYEGKNAGERAYIFLENIKNGNYDEYVAVKSKFENENYYGADIIYDKDENKVGIGLVSENALRKWFIHPDVKEYTFQNFSDTEEDFSNISWHPDSNVIFDKNKSVSDIPHDTITVEVRFKDGSVQSKQYDFSFNDNGDLVVDIIVP